MSKMCGGSGSLIGSRELRDCITRWSSRRSHGDLKVTCEATLAAAANPELIDKVRGWLISTYRKRDKHDPSRERIQALLKELTKLFPDKSGGGQTATNDRMPLR